MKKIVYEDSAGRIYVIHPIRDTHPSSENITEEQAFERAKKDIPANALNVTFLDEKDIPKDRSNRNNWRISSGKIDKDFRPVTPPTPKDV